MANVRKNPAMPWDPAPARHEVAVLALPDVIGFELGLPHRLLGSAADDDGRALYRVRVCTLDGGPVRTSAGYDVLPGHDAGILRQAATVVIPGLYRGPVVEHGRLEPELAATLEGLDARLISICTGAFALAAAGVLDGRRAATHWMHAERFRRLFPAVDLDADVLYIDDGEVLTSAGNAAGIDLLLHVLRRDHGPAVANRVARRAVVAPWREGGQSQFAEPTFEPDGRDGLAPTRAWAVRHLGEPITLAGFAGHAGVSVRTFTRRFRRETGVSPQRWLVAQRVERARRLLETTELPVERIAADVGFGTATSLRQHLHAAVGVPPLAYRRSYRGAAAAGPRSRGGRVPGGTARTR